MWMFFSMTTRAYITITSYFARVCYVPSATKFYCFYLLRIVHSLEWMPPKMSVQWKHDFICDLKELIPCFPVKCTNQFSTRKQTTYSYSGHTPVSLNIIAKTYFIFYFIIVHPSFPSIRGVSLKSSITSICFYAHLDKNKNESLNKFKCILCIFEMVQTNHSLTLGIIYSIIPEHQLKL